MTEEIMTLEDLRQGFADCPDLKLNIIEDLEKCGATEDSKIVVSEMWINKIPFVSAHKFEVSEATENVA